jgi:hypothetical protein
MRTGATTILGVGVTFIVQGCGDKLIWL